MTEIRNTTTDMRDPIAAGLFLLNQSGTADPGDPTDAIVAMEKAGQRQLVNSDRLPTDTGGTDEAFLALGFTFGPADPSDPLFRPATLPPGWARRATDHAMGSEIVDQHGRARVSIFYKAAFYDRHANMRLVTHYGYLSTCLYYDTTPVLDEEWLTVEGACEELERMAVRSDKDASEADDFAARDGNEYWTTRAAQLRAEAEKVRALVESIGGTS